MINQIFIKCSTRISALLVLLCLGSSVWASEVSPKPYVLSSLDESEGVVDKDYLIINSAPRKIRNLVRFENERRVNVVGKRETYRVNDGHTTQQAFTHYLDELKRLNADIVFQCASRDCGRSSSWSESVYKIPKLYGKDATQLYLSSRLVVKGEEWITTVYTVERGNRRVYIHVETLKVIEPGSQEAATISLDDSRLASSPQDSVIKLVSVVKVDMSGTVSIALTAGDTEELVKAISSASPDRIYVVGYITKRYSSVSDAVEASQIAADMVSKRLQDNGIGGIAINAIGVGPLVTVNEPRGEGNRAEVLIVTE